MPDRETSRRFRPAPSRVQPLAWTVIALVTLTLAVAGIVREGAVGLTGAANLLLAATAALMLVTLLRPGMTVDPAGITIHELLRDRRLSWARISRLTLDRAAVPAGRHGEALRVELDDRSTLTSGCVAGIPAQLDLERSLREQAEAHDVEVEVVEPAWRAAQRPRY